MFDDSKAIFWMGKKTRKEPFGIQKIRLLLVSYMSYWKEPEIHLKITLISDFSIIGIPIFKSIIQIIVE